jgi:hypothetical protein
MKSSDKISKVDLIDFIREFNKEYAYCGWSVEDFATELEDWLANKDEDAVTYRITIKRLGLTVGSVDIKSVTPPNDGETLNIVASVLPDYDSSVDTYELNDVR